MVVWSCRRLEASDIFSSRISVCSGGGGGIGGRGPAFESRKEAYNQGVAKGWEAGWTHAMKPTMDRYGKLDLPPVDEDVYQK